MPSTSDGPYLAAAFLCEKVLQEKDEAVSIIRIIDRVTLEEQLLTRIPLRVLYQRIGQSM